MTSWPDHLPLGNQKRYQSVALAQTTLPNIMQQRI
jgi:hypothetical protein